MPKTILTVKAFLRGDEVFISKKAGEWIAKPTIGERIHVTLSENRVLSVFTLFHFEMSDVSRILVIDVNSEDLDKERLDKLTRQPGKSTYP